MKSTEAVKKIPLTKHNKGEYKNAWNNKNMGMKKMLEHTLQM